MKTPRPTRVRSARWFAGVLLTLVAVGAAAHTVNATQDLRAALRQELGPLALAVKRQAEVVTAELARRLAVELTSTLRLGTPRAGNDSSGSASDRS